MNRIRLAAAEGLLKFARILLRVNASLIAGLPQAAPVVPSTPTNALEALRALVPPPTLEEVVSVLTRFVNERAPAHPDEIDGFIIYVGSCAESFRGTFEKLRAAYTPLTPPAPPNDDAVN
jgi:hypothetical protein